MLEVYNKISKAKASGQGQLAVLLDPDHQDTQNLDYLLSLRGENAPDFFFAGGSILKRGSIHSLISKIKQDSDVPVVIFPGGSSQINDQADAFLLLSLISGLNPKYLIGEHIEASQKLAESKLELIPTGYILVDGGTLTAVQEVSETEPIANIDIKRACATALAGSQLGLKCIYLESGSGAKNTVPEGMVTAVASTIDIPVIVGGGIKTAQKAKDLFLAGANLLVVGTALEQDESFLEELIKVRNGLRS